MKLTRPHDTTDTLRVIRDGIGRLEVIDDAARRARKALELLDAAIGTKQEGEILGRAFDALPPQVTRIRDGVDGLERVLIALRATWRMIPPSTHVVDGAIIQAPGTGGAFPSAIRRR